MWYQLRMSEGLRIVVTGGRNYTDKFQVARSLEAVRQKHGISVLIQGEACGADALCKEWAEGNGVEVLPYPAKWSDLSHSDALIRKRRDGTQYDARAGGRRNQQMIDEGKPDAAVAFKGGSGTADMCRRLRQAGVPVWMRP